MYESQWPKVRASLAFFQFSSFCKNIFPLYTLLISLDKLLHMALLAIVSRIIYQSGSERTGTWLCHIHLIMVLKSMGRCSKSKPTDFSLLLIFLLAMTRGNLPHFYQQPTAIRKCHSSLSKLCNILTQYAISFTGATYQSQPDFAVWDITSFHVENDISVNSVNLMEFPFWGNAYFPQYEGYS